jgi:hypothetical protein
VFVSCNAHVNLIKVILKTCKKKKKITSWSGDIKGMIHDIQQGLADLKPLPVAHKKRYAHPLSLTRPRTFWPSDPVTQIQIFSLQGSVISK